MTLIRSKFFYSFLHHNQEKEEKKLEYRIIVKEENGMRVDKKKKECNQCPADIDVN